MLAQLDSRQIGEWMAFSMLEQIGQPIPVDPDDKARGEAKAQRAKVEGGLRALKQNRGS